MLEDRFSQRCHRFSPAAYCLIGLMDGQRTVQEIWEQGGTSLGVDAPAQDDLIQLLAQLYSADALQCDVSPDVTAVLLSHDRQRRQRWLHRVLNPLSWQFSLIDPEPILQRLLPLARFIFSRTGAVLWLVVVTAAVALGSMHWQDLTHDITDRVLAPQNLIMLWLLFPVIKTLHEFGHAFATKVYGGEVHEMGIMFLVVQPVPYVDASSASAFRAKWERMMVGAAGMIVELFVAALAFFVWLNVEPGVVRALAYNTLFIAGVSTVLFNANPLLRYDGYYIFADYLEIPNLHARSQAYLAYLGERYLFGHREAPPDTASLTERLWLTVYPIAAFTYRIFVLFAIATFIASKFFFLGMIVALSGSAAGVLVPGVKAAVRICASSRLHSGRQRAIVVSAAVIAVLVSSIVWMPLPLRTRAEGVIWVPDEARVRAGADGFVERIVAHPGARVRRGDVLIVCQDPQLTTQVKVLEFRLEELNTRYAAQWLEDIRQAQVIREEVTHVEQRLARARERLAELVIRSRSDGAFVLLQAENLPGRFVQQGAHLGYVLDFSALTARVVVTQKDVDLVRHYSKKIEVRLADRPAESFGAVILREVPAASEQLPSTALGSQGGGSIAIDPGDQRGVKAVEKLFQFELGLPSKNKILTMGGRVYVRFDHGWQPLMHRWLRELRELFLSKFDG